MIAGLATGVAFVAAFSLVMNQDSTRFTTERPSHVTVVIPEGSSQPDSDHNNFEPETIKVVIGINNTVRWINQDIVTSSVIADSENDRGFYDATRERCENDDYRDCRILLTKNFLEQGESFEYTFTKPGEHG